MATNQMGPIGSDDPRSESSRWLPPTTEPKLVIPLEEMKGQQEEKVEDRRRETNSLSFMERASGRMKIVLPPPGTNALATSAFATYVLSLIGYVVYLLHGLLPADTVRNVLMISYFPSQVWSVILPAWLTVAFWYLFVVYFATNLAYTPPIDGPDGLASITDQSALILHSRISSLSHSDHQPPSVDQPVPVLRDLPCQVVNQFYFN
ncbi:hypothetical protein MJO28_005489 [Puccinia striiformis f. sp. tritici]|nr:hypothetical protein MJO28_005489 [Puccinia striiformis f. sp. tritici]